MMLSRLDSGRLEAGRKQVDSLRLARQLLGEVAPQAERHGITLLPGAPPDLPPLSPGHVKISALTRVEEEWIGFYIIHNLRHSW